MHSDPDAELVLLCQRASPNSLEGDYRRLYDRFKDRVYNVCFRIAGNPSDALDASQETFGILFRRIREFRFESRFSSWVYRVAVNASIDIRRRARSRRHVSLDALQEGSPLDHARFEPSDSQLEMPSVSASRRELELAIHLAISRLSPKLRTIVVLRYIENLSYEEVSEALAISLGTVKSRLSRAHEALDRELTPVLDKHYLG
ncbi:MAG: sigma-70 family RNA polymerase sigma factor [Planctomycetes bacterium]|nr:sigma-70 family RNA polymerase sigma factor [Planctomycetota bacterium]